MDITGDVSKGKINDTTIRIDSYVCELDSILPVSLAGYCP